MLQIRPLVMGIRMGLSQMPREENVVKFNDENVVKFVTNGGKTTKQIAEHFAQSPQKTLATLKRLCDDGKVRRNDGRVIVWTN